MKIIGISGRKQAGKTTAAEFIKRKTNAKIISFADPLKQIVYLCFSDRRLRDTDYDKNIKLSCGRTFRELLQLVGTDWFRHLDPDCWVRAYNKLVNTASIRAMDVTIITPDVRFMNEVDCIHKLGGHIIRLTRCPYPEDTHMSEIALLNGDNCFDAVVANEGGMSEDWKNGVISGILKTKGWI